MPEEERRRIRVTGQDPWVHQRQRGEAARSGQGAPGRRAAGGRGERREIRDRLDRRAGSSRRRQAVVLGLLFALLAAVFGIGSQVASPRIVVQLAGGATGVVYVDGERAGLTGQELGPFKLGAHEIVVETRGARYGRYVNLGWSLTPREILLHSPTGEATGGQGGARQGAGDREAPPEAKGEDSTAEDGTR